MSIGNSVSRGLGGISGGQTTNTTTTSANMTPADMCCHEEIPQYYAQAHWLYKSLGHETFLGLIRKSLDSGTSDPLSSVIHSRTVESYLPFPVEVGLHVLLQNDIKSTPSNAVNELLASWWIQLLSTASNPFSRRDDKLVEHEAKTIAYFASASAHFYDRLVCQAESVLGELLTVSTASPELIHLGAEKEESGNHKETTQPTSFLVAARFLSWLPHFPSSMIVQAHWMRSIMQLLDLWSSNSNTLSLVDTLLAIAQHHSAILSQSELESMAVVLLQRTPLLQAMRWFVRFDGIFAPSLSVKLLLAALASEDWSVIKLALYYLASVTRESDQVSSLCFTPTQNDEDKISLTQNKVQKPAFKSIWETYIQAFTITKEADSLIFYQPVEAKLSSLLDAAVSLRMDWIVLLFRNLLSSKSMQIRRQFILWLCAREVSLPLDMCISSFHWLIVQMVKHFPPHPPSLLVEFLTLNVNANPLLFDGIVASLADICSPIGMLAIAKSLAQLKPMQQPRAESIALKAFASMLPLCTMYEHAALIKTSLTRYLDAALYRIMDVDSVSIPDLIDYYYAGNFNSGAHVDMHIIPAALVTPIHDVVGAFHRLFGSILNDHIHIDMLLSKSRKLIFYFHSVLHWIPQADNSISALLTRSGIESIRDTWQHRWLETLQKLSSSPYASQTSKDGALALLYAILEGLSTIDESTTSWILLSAYFKPIVSQLDWEGIFHYFLLYAAQCDGPKASEENLAKLLGLLDIVPLILRLPSSLFGYKLSLTSVMLTWIHERTSSIETSVISIKMLAIAYAYFAAQSARDSMITVTPVEVTRIFQIRFASSSHCVPLQIFCALQMQLACSMGFFITTVEPFLEQLDCAVHSSVSPLLTCVLNGLLQGHYSRDKVVSIAEQVISSTFNVVREMWEDPRDMKIVMDALVNFIEYAPLPEDFDYEPFLSQVLEWSMTRNWMLRKLEFLFTASLRNRTHHFRILRRNVDWVVRVIGWIPAEDKSCDFSDFIESNDVTCLKDTNDKIYSHGHTLPETVYIRQMIIRWVSEYCSPEFRAVLATSLIQVLKTQMKGCKYPNYPPFYTVMYELTVFHLLVPDIKVPRLAIQGLLSCISEQTMVPVLHLLEWAISRLVICEPSTLLLLVQNLSWSSRAHEVISVLTVFIQLCNIFPTESILDQLLADEMCVWLHSHHFTIRVLAQALFWKRHQVRAQVTHRDGTALPPLLPPLTVEYLSSHEVSRHWPKLEKDHFLARSFDPTHIDIDFLLNGIFELSKSPDVKVSPPTTKSTSTRVEEIQNEQASTTSSPINPELSLPTEVDQGEVEDLDSDVFQRKISSLVLIDDRIEKPSAKRHSIIMNACLLKKIPNLAGLCRSSEIFLAEKLILPSLSVLKDPTFVGTAVTSDRWMPMEAVDPRDLLACIQAYRSQGYCIIGIEQSPSAVPLHALKFPARSMLVLGNEKQGIPASIMMACDILTEIRQFGKTKSLNAHVSGSLCLWEYVKQHAAL